MVVDEVSNALMREAVFILQAHEDGSLPGGRGLDSLLTDGPPHSQHGRFVDVEIDVDGIERNDGGQHSLIRRNEVAGREEVTARLALDGRSDLAEFQVKLVDRHARLPDLELGFGLGDRSAVLVDLLRTDRAWSGLHRLLVSGKLAWANLSCP